MGSRLAAYEDDFGYLPVAVNAQFDEWTIGTLPAYREAVRCVAKVANKDGYLYPPVEHSMRLTKRGLWRRIPHSARGALLWRLPATHFLRFTGVLDERSARLGPGAFLVHFLGFMFGYRCQFINWWIDGRVGVKSSADHLTPAPRQVAEIVPAVLARWNSFPERQRIVTINALLLHEQASTLELEWHRFQAEYQVLDAIFALARKTSQVAAKGRVPHEDRISRLCTHFEIPRNKDMEAEIVRLRNDLLHEALWDKRMVGKVGSMKSYYSAIWLNKLTRRLLFAILGLKGGYVKSSWWSLSQRSFDLMPTA